MAANPALELSYLSMNNFWRTFVRVSISVARPVVRATVGKRLLILASVLMYLQIPKLEALRVANWEGETAVYDIRKLLT